MHSSHNMVAAAWLLGVCAAAGPPDSVTLEWRCTPLPPPYSGHELRVNGTCVLPQGANDAQPRAALALMYTFEELVIDSSFHHTWGYYTTRARIGSEHGDDFWTFPTAVRAPTTPAPAHAPAPAPGRFRCLPFLASPSRPPRFPFAYR